MTYEKYLKGAIIFFFVSLFASSLKAQVGGSPGFFIRNGYSASSIGLGNADVSLALNSEINPLSNPALLGFQKNSKIELSYSSLPFDLIRNAAYGCLKLSDEVAVSATFINSGVLNIDYRDASGEDVGTGFTSNNVLVISYGNKLTFGIPFIDNISIGLSVRMYLEKLHEDIPLSFGLGFDVGITYQFFFLGRAEKVGFGVSVSDINSSSRWSTNTLDIRERFPLSIKAGVSYQTKNKLFMQLIVLTFEVETLLAEHLYLKNESVISNGWVRDYKVLSSDKRRKKEVLLRSGVLLIPVEYFRIRLGIDRIGLSGISLVEYFSWSAGVSVFIPLSDGIDLNFDYTFLYERYSPHGIHVASLGITIN